MASTGRSIILVGLVQNHHSTYASLLDILEKVNGEISFLTIKSNEPFFSLRHGQNLSIVYAEGSTTGILKRHKTLISSHDILIIDELFGGFKGVWDLTFKNPVKLSLVHNCNRWFRPKLVFNIGAMARELIKNRYINQFDGFITIAPNVRTYLKSLLKSTPVFVVPFNEGEVKIRKSDRKKKKIMITVPGMITQKRRDYMGLLESLEFHYKKFPDSRINVQLLGRIRDPLDMFIGKRAEAINASYGPKITYWESFVPDEEFDENLSKADILLSNINPVLDLQDRTEIYGLSKESGISFAILKYAKPAIVPYTQLVLIGMDSQILRYNDNGDLGRLWDDLEMNRIDLIKLASNALSNQQILNAKFALWKEELIHFLND